MKTALPLDERACFGLADILEDEFAGEILPAEKRLSAPNERARLEAIQSKLHDARRSALCLSGGGIRSATFALGVIQALAKRGLLTPFDYLSTVSGGGYLGGWLSAWIKHRGDLEAVARDLNKDLRNSDDAERDPESEPIRHLRRYSNYLTPKLGVFSSDTWTLVATILRNIFLNWLMLIPILAGVLMVPRLVSSFAMRVGPPAGVIAGVLVFGLVCTLIGTIYSALDLPTWRKIGEAENAEESKLTDGGYGWFCLFPLLLAALLFSVGWFWFIGSFPDHALRYAHWEMTRGAWFSWPSGASFFCYAMLAASLPAGIIAMLVRKRRILGTWKEPLAMSATALAGGVALWFVLGWMFGDLVPYRLDAIVINYLCFAPSLVLLVFLLMNFVYVGTFSRSTTTEDREWWARSAGWILVTALGWAAASVIVLWGPIGLQVLLHDRSWIKTAVTALGGATGILTALLGFSTRTVAKKKDGAGGSAWLSLGAIVFLLFLITYIALATSWLEAKLFGVSTAGPVSDDPRHPADYRAFYSTIVLQMEVWKIFVIGAGFGLVGLLVGFLVNVNQFSLHAMYNARLTRAYLGASRARRGRAPHWFTGFDADDKLT
ncbi:MAG TPA: patatin-like phospholipase family protein, partial [Chthoniobacterales bacterium]|nr:patatin-like phospholipase family protein [Chthoniobacterales bacterium]